jgi:voltage-gated potassium channel
MKFLPSLMSYFFQKQSAVRNVKTLVKYILFLFLLVITYSILFHFIMQSEGREYSWITGFYWTLTVMTTLGFGDIIFTTDLGKIFSMIVMTSGVVFLLVLLPFTFIQFFYAPWLEAQERSRAPKELPPGTKDHVIITGINEVSFSLIEKLNYHNQNYVILVEDLQQAFEFFDKGYKVAVGNLDDPETYEKMIVSKAALVVTLGTDEQNTKIAYTVRELSETVPITAKANSGDSVDILNLAGCSHVIELPKMLGESLARRTIGGDARANIVGQFDQLLIAEAPAAGTPLVGKTIKESRLRESCGVTIVGMWERGKFLFPYPDTKISNSTVLVLTGKKENFVLYDELFCIYHVSGDPVLILGGGRVGRATGAALEKKGLDYRIIEKLPERNYNKEKTITGSASDLEVLTLAGIQKTPTVIVTTSDDATNIYLTIYCRRLRPDAQIISRSNLDRNVSTLHRAGADLVMSYASLGSNSIFNILQKDKVLMFAEGLDIFRFAVPDSLAGKKLLESGIREKSECSVLAISTNGEYNLNPESSSILEKDQELVLIGTLESEKKFIAEFID